MILDIILHILGELVLKEAWRIVTGGEEGAARRARRDEEFAQRCANGYTAPDPGPWRVSMGGTGW